MIITNDDDKLRRLAKENNLRVYSTQTTNSGAKHNHWFMVNRIHVPEAKRFEYWTQLFTHYPDKSVGY